MNINLQSILPDDISDEAAYCIVDLFAEISTAIEEYYFTFGKRNTKHSHLKSADDTQHKINFGSGDPF